MTAHRGEFDTPFSTPSRRKKGRMESSMLEYSQHMRKLNDSRSGAYKYDSRQTKGEEQRNEKPVLENGYTIGPPVGHGNSQPQGHSPGPSPGRVQGHSPGRSHGSSIGNGQSQRHRQDHSPGRQQGLVPGQAQGHDQEYGHSRQQRQRQDNSSGRPQVPTTGHSQGHDPDHGHKQRGGPTPPLPHTSRDSPGYEKKPTLAYTRRRRPLSFDENDLQRNQKLKLLKQRPYRDTKSERPPLKIPSGLPPISDSPAFHSSSSPDLDAIHRQKQLRVNLVNAADLYDLVDIRIKDNQHDNSARIANTDEGVRLMEEMEWAKPQRRHNQLEPLPHHHYTKFAVKPERTVPSKDDPNLLVGKSIKSEFVNPKSNTNKASRDKPKHDDVYFLDKEYEKGRILYRNTPDTNNSSTNSERVLDVFLEQAASKHKTSRVLKSRPKRAKRMQLHKPDLLSIPEDGGSFIRPPHGPSSEASRKEMLSSSTHVPYPSSTSLSAIKEVSPRSHESRVSESSFRPLSDAALSPQRKSHDDYHRYGHPGDDGVYKKSPRSQKASGGKVDLDSVIMTSIYSGLAIEPDPEHNSKLKHVTLERSSPKERAQKKMKRLIFLRDQPEQNYRREF